MSNIPVYRIHNIVIILIVGWISCGGVNPEVLEFFGRSRSAAFVMVSDRVCALWGVVRYVRWVRCVAASNVIMEVLLGVRAVGRAVGVIRVIFLAEVGVHSSSGQGTRRRRSLVLGELDELHDARGKQFP